MIGKYRFTLYPSLVEILSLEPTDSCKKLSSNPSLTFLLIISNRYFIQLCNLLLHIIMGEMVTRRSVVVQAGVFSVLADETKDCSKSEQMPIVVRYVDIKEATIHERFLTYVEVSDLDAKSLSEYILTTLHSHHLDLHCLVMTVLP